jgi:hypothetical protein
MKNKNMVYFKLNENYFKYILKLSEQMNEENGYKKVGEEGNNKVKNRYPDVLPCE